MFHVGWLGRTGGQLDGGDGASAERIDGRWQALAFMGGGGHGGWPLWRRDMSVVTWHTGSLHLLLSAMSRGKGGAPRTLLGLLYQVSPRILLPRSRRSDILRVKEGEWLGCFVASSDLSKHEK